MVWRNVYAIVAKAYHYQLKLHEREDLLTDVEVKTTGATLVASPGSDTIWWMEAMRHMRELQRSTLSKIVIVTKLSFRRGILMLISIAFVLDSSLLSGCLASLLLVSDPAM
jgi:hypothetical protein